MKISLTLGAVDVSSSSSSDSSSDSDVSQRKNRKVNRIEKEVCAVFLKMTGGFVELC